MRPALSRYSVTTFEPGASEVFTHGLLCSPRASALRARMPAPTITDGLDVLVQLVIAAITTCPWSSFVAVAVGERDVHRASARRCAVSPAPTAPPLASSWRLVAAERAPLRASRRSCRWRRDRSRESSPPTPRQRRRSRARAPQRLAERAAWRRSARRDPAGAWARRCSAPLRPDRARSDRRRSAPRSARRATAPARARMPRPARSARRGRPESSR